MRRSDTCGSAKKCEAKARGNMIAVTRDLMKKSWFEICEAERHVITGAVKTSCGLLDMWNFY